MGALWSQDVQVHQESKARGISANLSISGTKRKFVESGTENEQAENDVCALVDETPDGQIHKYIVSGSSIYWCTRKDIVKILSKVKDMPPYGGLHKISKWDHFFITFPNKTCAEKGVERISATEYRSEPFKISPTTEHSAKRARTDALVLNSKQQAVATMPDGLCPSAADVTAKWRDVPYEDQIERKRRKWLNSLRLVSKKMRKEVREVGRLRWLDEISRTHGKSPTACCSLEDIVTADSNGARMHYRNKNEFTIGMSPDSCGKQHTFHRSEIAVGYALGLVRDGQVFIGEVDDRCHTTSTTAIGIAKCLTPVIRSLNMPVYDKRTHQGYWRQITCREGIRTGEVIVSIVVNEAVDGLLSHGSSFTKEGDKQCRREIVRALREHFGTMRRFGVFWQTSSHISAVSSSVPAVRLYGIDGLREEMCGLTFRIQPNAFFQVNTIMAERLYKRIGDFAGVTENTVVLDVCCGTGTIGLSLAQRAHSVVGIEMNESAIADANYNAELNGIRNASFVLGKVEDKIYEVIKQLDGRRECVVILDPPRAGLPMNVIAAVRSMKAVKRIVYVACEPNNFWRNALGFCRPRSKAFRLDPFRPARACGVDLFPHTDHGELVVLLERETVEESERRVAEKGRI